MNVILKTHLRNIQFCQYFLKSFSVFKTLIVGAFSVSVGCNYMSKNYGSGAMIVSDCVFSVLPFDCTDSLFVFI